MDAFEREILTTIAKHLALWQAGDITNDDALYRFKRAARLMLVPCAHDDRCCLRHKIHLKPHRGCVLR